jgi:outer membrane protein TolC
LLGATLTLSGCAWVIRPQGEEAERVKVAQAEEPYRQPIEKRPLPDLSRRAPLPQVLDYAFSAGGELEAAYREWRGALERVPQPGALPDPKLEFKTVLNPFNPESLGKVLQSLSLDLSQEVPRKAKRVARADQALAQARGAGEKFRAAKYQLQNKVVGLYAQLALNEETTALTSETLRLLGQTHELALHRFHSMAEGALSDVYKIEIEIEKQQSELRALENARARLVGELNGALNRSAGAPLGKTTLAEVNFPKASQEELFARAVEHNAELASLRREIEARGAAQTLANLEKKPDFMVSGGLDESLGDLSSLSGFSTPMLNLGVNMNLPLNRERIRAAIAEALAMRQAADARYAAARSNTQARLVMALASIRDTQRVITDYDEHIVPAANRLLDTQLSTYGSGGGEFLDVLDTERLLIDFKQLVLQARADRLRFYGELEEVLGEDLLIPKP